MKITTTITTAILAFALIGCEQENKSQLETLVESWSGKTVQYTWQPGREDGGKEYYYPKSNKLLYLSPDGVCLFGRYKIDGNYIHYYYPNSGVEGEFTLGIKDGENVLVHPFGPYQTIEIISDQKLNCEPTNVEVNNN